jgi:hypothetical protein
MYEGRNATMATSVASIEINFTNNYSTQMQQKRLLLTY